MLIAATSALIAVLFRLLVAAEHRRAVGVALLLGLGLRFASAAILYFGAEGMGRTVFSSTVPIYYVVGDDASYAELSWGVLQWMQGHADPRFVPVSWFGQAYLIGSFFFLELFVFWLFGPIMLNIQVVNGALGGATLLLVYSIAQRLLGSRPALVSAFTVALLPSLVLWNSVGLKDSLALALIAAVLWLFARFRDRPHWALLLAIFVVMIPIETTRRYLYVVLSGLFPFAVLLTPRLALARRIGMTTGATLLAFALLSLGSGAGQGTYGIPTGFGTFEAVRLGMGEGARTSYAEPRSLVVSTGDRFVVVDADKTPGPTLQPGTRVVVDADKTPGPTLQPGTRCVVVVPPGGRIVIGTPDPGGAWSCPPPGPPRAVTTVQAGDIVVIGDTTAPAPSAAPGAPLTNLALRPSLELGNQIDVIVTNTPESLTLTRTLSYLPRGLAYAFFAPFPWAAERTLDLLTIPQALFWYLCLAVLPWSLWSLRRRAVAFLPQLGYVGGMMLIFTLVEGNFGTLYRHRDMVTPFVVMLATPGLLMLWDRVSAGRRRA